LFSLVTMFMTFPSVSLCDVPETPVSPVQSGTAAPNYISSILHFVIFLKFHIAETH